MFLNRTMFRQRLAEAIAWCRARPRNAIISPFRTPALWPPLVRQQDDIQYGWNYLDVDQSGDVEDLCVKRAALLESKGVKLEPYAPGVTTGRILQFKAGLSLCDGAACETSQGFFDYSNAPPWDTWIVYLPPPDPDSSDMLFSWVPEDFVQIADAGISVNPEECLRWATEDELRDLLEPNKGC